MLLVGDASIFTRRRARRLSDQARAAMRRPPVLDDDPTPLRTMVVGPDPIRILLFGSGPLIGYGVDRRSDAIDGHLARLLAERTGRGVIVESRVRLGLPIEKAVGSLGGAGTATYAAAVWAPCFGEELHYSSPRRSRAAVRAMLHEFRGVSHIPLVLCHLPRPLGADWRTVLRRPRVARFNAVLEEEGRAAVRVTSVALGTYTPSDPASTTAAWHRTQAERLAPAVLEQLAESSSRS